MTKVISQPHTEEEILRNNAINYALQKADHHIAELQGHLYTSYAVIVLMLVALITVGIGPR